VFLEIEHRLFFEYDAYISESFLELRVQPKTTPHQTLASFVLAVGPPTRVSRYQDWNDNATHHFTITRFHDRIQVESRAHVATHPATPDPRGLGDPLPLAPLPYPLLDFLGFEGPVSHTPALETAAREVGVPAGAPLGAHVAGVARFLRERFEYQKNVTRVDSTTDDFLRLRAGVCQDYAHLMLGLLRLRGVPCRYVSGYLHVPASGEEPAQSHAWVEVHSPAAGWVPFDPTHDRPVDERYVVVGHGRHYDDVPPNKGIFRGVASETLRAEVRTRVTDAPAAARPEEVQAIDLKVFRELPRHRPERLLPPAEDLQAEQQQQQ
jgi:transglutaminase-like putative cysteine protease